MCSFKWCYRQIAIIADKGQRPTHQKPDARIHFNCSAFLCALHIHFGARNEFNHNHFWWTLDVANLLHHSIHRFQISDLTNTSTLAFRKRIEKWNSIISIYEISSVVPFAWILFQKQFYFNKLNIHLCGQSFACRLMCYSTNGTNGSSNWNSTIDMSRHYDNNGYILIQPTKPVVSVIAFSKYQE